MFAIVCDLFEWMRIYLVFVLSAYNCIVVVLPQLSRWGGLRSH